MKRIAATENSTTHQHNYGDISLSMERLALPMKQDGNKPKRKKPSVAWCLATLAKLVITVAMILLSSSTIWITSNIAKQDDGKNDQRLIAHFTTSPKQISTTKPRSGRKLFEQVLKDAFPFARNPTEFRHQVTFLSQEMQQVTEDEEDYVYSKEDLALILRSLYTLLGFMNMPLWSGSPAYQHFIGTGSCLARLKRPAKEVALGLLHGIYVQSWHPDLKTIPTDECQRRSLLNSVLGSELEKHIFYESGVFGNGPQHSCLHVYKDMLVESRSSNNQTIQTIVESIPYHFILCDEIEEFLGGDVSLANNWKRRDEHHFDLLQDMARLINEPKLVSWIETARQMTIALYNTTDYAALYAYKEVSPRLYKFVYNRSIETFRVDADPQEVDRMKFVQDTSRREWPMLSSYFRPGESASFNTSITATRSSCNAYHERDSSITPKAALDDFISVLDTLRTQTLATCDVSSSVADSADIPFPFVPPESVKRTRFV